MSQLLNTFHCVELVEQSGLPRKVLRSLLVGNGLGPASRVLVVGGGSEDLLRCLDGLGLLVSGFESDPVQLANLRRKNSLFDWRGGGPRETAFLPDQSFDLVLVRQHPAYAGSLFGADACRTTAELLASLRPSGTLAFIDQLGENGASTTTAHRESCCSKHLAAFPGVIQAEVHSDAAVRSRLPWSQPSPAAFWIVQITIAATAVGRSAWKRYGEAAAAATGACCEDSARSINELRSAA